MHFSLFLLHSKPNKLIYLDETDTLAEMKIAECDSNRKYHIFLTASILQNQKFLRLNSIETIFRTLHTKQVAAMPANSRIKISKHYYWNKFVMKGNKLK